MSSGYPDGCTQATHDRAFDSLGPSPDELFDEVGADEDRTEEDQRIALETSLEALFPRDSSGNRLYKVDVDMDFGGDCDPKRPEFFITIYDLAEAQVRALAELLGTVQLRQVAEIEQARRDR